MAERAQFKIGPLGYAIPASQFEDWLAAAPVGARIIYATGLALPQGAPSVVCARAEAAAGRVTLTSKQETREGVRCWEWMAEKVGRTDAAPLHHPAASASPASRSAPPPRAGEVPDDSDEQDAILRAFRRAVNLRGVAPTNAELASICGLSNGERARYLVGKLISRGLIKVSDQGPRARRIVTIVATGRETVGGKL